ncbi:MAG: right-handed parallel beta-helix repeat-containing protein [Saccharofermentanales bacterium]
MIEFTVEEPVLDNITKIDITDFGVSEKNHDNNRYFADAFLHCSGKSGIYLNIPKGVYRFDCIEQMVLNDASNIIIDGNESVFIFEKPGYFNLNNCSHVKFQNIIIDWDWDKKRLADLGRVINIEEQNRYIDVEYLEVADADEKLPFDLIFEYDPVDFTPGVKDGKTYAFDSCKVSKTEKTGKANVLRIYPDEKSLIGMKKDEVYLFRHYGYWKAVFWIYNCDHLTFENVVIYSAHGTAYVITGETHHYRLNHCTVGLKPGSNRKISTTTDGLIIGSSKGYCIFENCDFSYLGDDAINIHDTIGLVEKKISDRSISAFHSPVFVDGDTCELKSNDFSPENIYLKVKNYSVKDGKHILEFYDDLPEDISQNLIIINRRFDSSNYIIRNNYFHESRSRVVIQSSNGLVENNRFYKMPGPNIYIMLEILKGLWYEGTGAENITIRGNTFERCNVCDWFSVIDIRCELFSDWEHAGIPADKRNEKKLDYPVFKNIRITDNKFSDFPGYLFYIYAAENVLIENNHVENKLLAAEPNKNQGKIFISSSKDINIANNDGIRKDYLNN